MQLNALHNDHHDFWLQYHGLHIEAALQQLVHFQPVISKICILKYTGDHVVWDGPLQDFTFDPINQKLKVVQKQMIYHLKALIVGF